METHILEAESAASKIEEQLNDPGFYKENAASASTLHEELESKREEIQALYDRWEELEAVRAASEAAN